MRRASRGITGAVSAIILVVGVALILVASLFAVGVFPSGGSPGSTTTIVSTPITSSGAENSSSTTTLNMTTTQVTLTLSSSTHSSFTTSSVSLTSSTSTVLSTSATISSSTSTTTKSSTTTTATVTSSRSTSSATSTQPGTVQIILPQDVGNNESLNFTPSKVKVVIGVNNTIVWNDEDYVQHTVQSVSVPGGASRWNSGILNEGQSYTVTLTVPGNYKYNCSIHPDWMVGTIQVLA